MYEIKIEDNGTLAGLARMEQATHNATPLARSISNEFLSQTEANLEAEGRPQWLGLSPDTIKARSKNGTWPGKIMQVSGQLAASFTPGYNAESAWIGSNKVYAAMQHSGGVTSPRSMIPNKVIEPRPSIPADAQGNLQPEAEHAVMGLANNYLSSIIR
jgi:phage virion morphogenesis protein